MLHHFFAKEVEGKPTKDLFENLEISKDKKFIEEYQGKYPIIFISVKDIKQDTGDSAIEKIQYLISKLYQAHLYLISSNKLDKIEKEVFEKFAHGKVSNSLLEDSIQYLSKLIYKHFKQYSIILIDEYDTPIQEAYLNGYYDEFIQFMVNLLGAGLKDNGYFRKAILTGITRVSKESLFSGLNHIDLCTLMSGEYSNYFGFTEEEVTDLLAKTNTKAKADLIKSWYNGYQCGRIVLYNPWSIINCIADGGKLKPYWVNTSSNKLAKRLLLKSGTNVHSLLQDLIENKAVEELVDEHVVYANIENQSSAIWSLLLMAGYLKITDSKQTFMGFKKYTLAIPNEEVKYFYYDMVRNWVSGDNGINWYETFITTLITGKIDAFIGTLQKLLIQVISFRDTKEPERESFYHGLVLGLVVGLGEHFEIRSNKESGDGFYDLMLIPKNLADHDLGIIIELKKSDKDDDLSKRSDEAFAQSETKAYDTELKTRGVKRAAKIGIAFSAKKLAAKHEIVNF